MQNLERIPSVAPTRRELELEREKKRDQAAADDFSQLMQRALAPKSKESPREIALRAERKHAATAKTSEASSHDATISARSKISQDDSQADEDADNSVAKTSAEPTQKNSDSNVFPTDMTDAPVLLPMPLTACFVSPQTAADFSAASKVKSALTGVSANGGPEPIAATSENSKTDLAAAQNSKSLVTELAPVKPEEMSGAQTGEPVKNQTAAEADALLKKLAETENAKPATSADSVQKAGGVVAAVLPAAAEEKGGTGVAIVDSSMKKNANTIKVAGLDGKVLPSEASVAAREKVLPTLASAGPVRAADNNSADANIGLALTNTFSALDFSSTQSTLILPSLTDARLRNLERTHDMVAMHALRLVDAQTDFVHVVIKPGAGTELSLQLRQRDGVVQAEATLQRGDYQLMNQHWPELQQRLELRGIKLAPLGGDGNFSADSGGHFKQQQQSARELEAQKASAFAEFAMASRVVGATARLAVGVTGWESWA